MKKLFLAFLILGMKNISGAACFPHPNLILCWPTFEGIGTVTKDYSLSSLDGTLTGGPAWSQSSNIQSFGHTASTMTSTAPVNWSISFTNNVGVDVRSANTNIFDFSGSKPYIIVFSFEAPQLPLNLNQTMIAYTDGTTGVGWSMHMDSNGGIVMCHIANANSPATRQIRDRNRHRFMVMRTGTTLWMFLDGKHYNTVTGHADMNPVSGVPVKLSGVSISASGTWSGKLGQAAIYNFCPPTLQEAIGFAQNEYLHWQNSGGTGNQW